MHTINLSGLEDRVIDLQGLPNHIVLTGHYYGPSLLLKNSSGSQAIKAERATIGSDEGFAIKLLNCLSFRLISDHLTIKGGIQVIGDLPGLLELKGVHVSNADVGLHMTQHHGNERYGIVSLRECSFKYCSHEGVYIGKTVAEGDDKQYPKTSLVRISGCEFTRNQWDGAQIAQCETLYVEDSIFAGNGLAGKNWQDKDLVLNRGVDRADIVNCLVGKQVQALETGRLFIR